MLMKASWGSVQCSFSVLVLSIQIMLLWTEVHLLCFVMELAPSHFPFIAHLTARCTQDILYVHTHWSLLHMMTGTNLLPLHLMLMFKWKWIVYIAALQVVLYLPVCPYAFIWEYDGDTSLLGPSLYLSSRTAWDFHVYEIPYIRTCFLGKGTKDSGLEKATERSDKILSLGIEESGP